MRRTLWLVGVFGFIGRCFAMPLPVTNICQALPHYVEANQNVIGDSVYFFATVGGLGKHFRISKAWGSDFSVSVRVEEKVQGDLLYNAIEALGYKVDRYTPSASLDMALPLPVNEGSLDLFIPLTSKKSLPEVIQSLSGRLVEPRELMPKHLENTEEMRRWVFWNFAGLRLQRSKELSDWLFAFRTSGYKAIQDPLRNAGGSIPEFLSRQVRSIDSAIKDGVLDRNIVIYHTDTNPTLEEVWHRGIEAAPVNLPVDPAYTFASMLKSFATWWGITQYKGKGVILEIEAEKGSHMIPMEKLRSEPEWLTMASELEFLLPRNSQFVATRASLDSDGNKVLHCKLVQR